MIARGSSSTSPDDVRKACSEFDIACRYLGVSHIPEIILSPLRMDRSPSFSLFENRRNGHIMYRDFGTGEHGNLFGLLSRIWCVSVSEACDRILKDIPPQASSVRKSKTGAIHRRSSGKIEVRVREWRRHDLDYWNSYGISSEWLKFGDIHPISHVFITKGKNTYMFPAEKYAYAYVERKDNKVSLKIYQPFSKLHKWISKHDSSVWDLWTKLPENGEDLIITSSRKDALCLWENTGIPSLSLQGEGYVPKEHVIDQLKKRFRNIFILYDNDFRSEENHGRAYGKALAEKFHLKQIEIPEEYESKDPSDLVHNHGRETLRKVVHNLIKTS